MCFIYKCSVLQTKAPGGVCTYLYSTAQGEQQKARSAQQGTLGWHIFLSIALL